MTLMTFTLNIFVDNRLFGSRKKEVEAPPFLVGWGREGFELLSFFKEGPRTAAFHCAISQKVRIQPLA